MQSKRFGAIRFAIAPYTCYFYHNHQLIARIDKTGNQQAIHYYHTDILGSPIAGSDSKANLEWQEDYAPYGKRLLKQGKDNGQWYTGKTEDEVTSFVYMNARYYDPEIARFISPDPIHFTEQNPFSFNRYLYANNNPLKFVDPDGRETLVVVGMGTGWNVFSGDNPFGHVAIGFTGRGVYSFGTATKFGSSLVDYLEQQNKYRNSIAYELETSLEQENRMIDVLKGYRGKPLQRFPDNCAARTNHALDVGMGFVTLPFPGSTQKTLESFASNGYARRIRLPRGTANFGEFKEYEPR